MHPSFPLISTHPHASSLLSLSHKHAPGVLDKGTLDALMCGDVAERDAHEMLGEVRWREGG
jgi:hypothetical protein